MKDHELDRLIYRLRGETPSPPNVVGVGFVRHDWRPIWALCKEIQAAFKSGVQYPSRSLRDAAWTSFSELRDTAYKTAEREREMFTSRSEPHRDNILYMCKGISYSPLADILFLFDKTTAEQMKAFGHHLAKAMKALSEHKHEMTREHKDEVYSRIQDVKESHDLFWGHYKSAHEGRRVSNESRRESIVESVERNLSSNQDRLRKSREGLAHARARVEEVEDKIATATTAKWEGIFREWLEEAENKVQEIEASIARIEEWIAEDEERLRSLRR